MTQSRDCPMCGEIMHLKTREHVDYIPGQSQTVVTVIKEWICPDCDYFEEYEPEADSEEPPASR